MYDLIANIYYEKMGWKDHEETQFYQDIWPVMHGSYALSWVNRDAYEGHGMFISHLSVDTNDLKMTRHFWEGELLDHGKGSCDARDRD